MKTKPQTVLEEALALSATDRARIAEALLASLEPDGTPEEIETAWGEEITARVAALDAGESETVPWEEVRDRVFSSQREPQKG